ncbi:MAG: hypothetical protein ACLR0U_16760 [Enterocloster clostridioformis]
MRGTQETVGWNKEGIPGPTAIRTAAFAGRGGNPSRGSGIILI